MTQVIASKEDKENFEKKYGKHFDNVTVKKMVDGCDVHLQLGIFKLDDKFVARAGMAIDTSIAGEASETVTGAIKNTLKVL